MAWSHQDKDTELIYFSPSTSSIGGVPEWAAPRIACDPPAYSSGTPSIAGNQTPICMAWKGASGDPRIWYSLWDTAAGVWGPQMASSFQTEQSPNLVHFRGRTLMFWNNSAPMHPLPEYYNRIVYSELVDGQWVHPFEPGDYNVTKADWLSGVEGVAATWDAHEDALYIAWREVNEPDVNSVWWRRLDDRSELGFLWQEDGVIPAAASAPPALVSDGNALYAAWRNAGDDHISWAWSVSGGSWFGPYSLTDRLTSAGPALAALGTSDIVMAWKGGGDDTRLWWSRLRNGVWGEQQPFPDRAIHADRRVSLWSPILG